MKTGILMNEYIDFLPNDSTKNKYVRHKSGELLSYNILMSSCKMSMIGSLTNM